MTIRSALVFAGLWLVASQRRRRRPHATSPWSTPSTYERPAETITLAAPALLEALQVKDVQHRARTRREVAARTC